MQTVSKALPLKILLSNHHLMSYQGSENYTFTIADYLIRRGHKVTVYSAYFGKLRKRFEAIGVEVITELRSIRDRSFDIAHVHHHINTLEVRYYFPHLPIVLLCHGIIFLEHPPPFDLKISQYMATSERVMNHMVHKGVAKEKITLFRNMVDSELFSPTSSIQKKPKTALIISNKIDVEKENVIKEACSRLGIKTEFIGTRFRSVDYRRIPSLINRADIVFSLGRGAIEAMLCGRIPIIFDYEGGDGMVSPESICQNMSCNFSGNLFNVNYTVEQLIEILQEYRVENGTRLREMAIEYFGADKRIQTLIDIYYRCLNTPVEPMDSFHQSILHSFVSSIEETRRMCRSSQYILTLLKQKLMNRLKI